MVPSRAWLLIPCMQFSVAEAFGMKMIPSTLPYTTPWHSQVHEVSPFPEKFGLLSHLLPIYQISIILPSKITWVIWEIKGRVALLLTSSIRTLPVPLPSSSLFPSNSLTYTFTPAISPFLFCQTRVGLGLGRT